MGDLKSVSCRSAVVAHAPSPVHPTRAEIDELLKERLQTAIHAESETHCPDSIARLASEHAAIDLAYAASKLPTSTRSVVYDNLPTLQAKVDFIINTDPSTRSIVYRHLSDEELQRLVAAMPSDEAVWALDALSERRFRRLLDGMPAQQALAIQQLHQHDRRSAGRLMTSDFFAFTADVTIGEAADHIRNHPGIDLTRRIFVVEADGRLEGYVPARNLIINRREKSLRQIMQPIVHQVVPEASREEVVDLVERYKIPALPVVENERLVGVITYEDVVETLEDIADETIAQMAGTLEDVTAYEPIYRRFLARAPWLIVTLCAGLVNAANINHFGASTAPWLAFLLFFVPLITGMSGNVGVQCSTVLVRGMALGLLAPGMRREAICKELTIGLVTGLAFGVLCGGVIYGLSALGIQNLGANPFAAGIIVSSGLFGACLVATLLGVFSPLFFARIGVDPAVSSGPIVTACNDVLAMVIYFLIAQGMSLFFVSQTF
jgi:magnesium transporter